MPDITTTDWEDYCAGRSEPRERPAEPGDFRFDIGPKDEDGYCRVEMIDDKGNVVSSDYTDNPYGMVEAFRESQAHSFEELYEPYGIRWQQEMREEGRL